MKLSKDEVVDELATLVDAIIAIPDHMTHSAESNALVDMLRKRSQWLRKHYEEDNE